MKVLLHVVVVMAANLTAPETTYNWSWIPWGHSHVPPLEPPSPPESHGVGSRMAWERAWLYVQELLAQDGFGADQAGNTSSPSGDYQSDGGRAHWFFVLWLNFLVWIADTGLVLLRHALCLSGIRRQVGLLAGRRS